MSFEQTLFILVSILLCLLLGRVRPSLCFIFFAAFILRTSAVFFEEAGYIQLPWSGSDSVGFYADAVYWGKGSWAQIFSSFDLSTSRVYSWVLSFFIKIFGEGEFFLRMLNVVLGSLLVLQVFHLAREFTSQRTALWAASVCAFFPVSIVLSAVLLREALITVLVTLTVHSIVLFIKHKKIIHIFSGSLALLSASALHGALFLGFAVIPLVLIFFGHEKSEAVRIQTSVAKIVSVIFFGAFLLFISTGGVQFSKIGSVEDVSDRLQSRLERVNARGAKGGSGYPAYLTSGQLNPGIFAMRFVYFIGAPFPWEYRSVFDALAGGIGAIYLFMLFRVLTFWRQYRNVMKAVVLLFLFFVILYSVGSDNVGTAIRHKSKFFPILLVLYVWVSDIRKERVYRFSRKRSQAF